MYHAVSKAFETGNFEDGLYILRHHPHLVDYRIPNTRADTLLLAACIHGRPDVVKELLNMKAEPFFNTHSIHGRNVFTVAQNPVQQIVLEHILEHTKEWKEPESVLAWETAFEGAIEDAFYTGNFQRALRILRYRPKLINHVTKTGVCLINVAQKYERVDIVKKLFEMGADPWAGSSNPFDYSSSTLQQNILSYILEKTHATSAGIHWDDWEEFSSDVV
jgi:hypothetical protein